MTELSIEPEVEIVEVGPRDGLQNESKHLSTAQKVELIARLAAAGLSRVEAVSFVHPGRVPQMADAEAVLADPMLSGPAAQRPRRLVGLVLNERGFARAALAGLAEINVSVMASDTFNRRNQGVSTADSLAEWSRIAAAARASGMRATLTIGAAFGCPFEGEVPIARLIAVVAEAAELLPAELALADTIGAASPKDVRDRFAAARAAAPGVSLRAHFHNTRNTGLANALAALECGVRVLDASVGGIGGCPFAPRATGNVPTEDLAWMLTRMGVATGLDLAALAGIAEWLETVLGHAVPGLYAKAGPFPA